MFSINGVVITFSIINIFNVINGVEIDLISDLNHLENVNNLLQRKDFGTNGESSWSLNLTDSKLRKLILSKKATINILNVLMNNSDFGICIILRQDSDSTGTIFSITNENKARLFEIKISPESNFIKIIYSPENRIRGSVSEKLKYTSSKNPWHSLCFQYNNHNKLFSIRSDCYDTVSKKLRFGLPSKKFNKMPLNEFQIYIGQRNYRKNYYKGMIKQMIFSSTSNFSSVYCSSLLKNAITQPVNTLIDISSINSRLNEMEKQFIEIKIKLFQSENKLKNFEQCQCFPICKSSIGETKLLKEIWLENSCRNCTCTYQGTKCVETKCPILQCQHKIVEPGQCCERCGHPCQYHGNQYSHLGNFTINCLNCHCFDGSLTCRRINPKTECPPLNCNRFLQVKIPGKCCKYCKKINLCEFSSCGTNGYCITSSTLFTCQCKLGYHGNPYRSCQDINECDNNLTCPPSTDCINTEGSFTCVCKPGYIRSNSSTFGCVATCIKNKCRNNSTCVSPDKCKCRVGYTGEQCDQDIDECKLRLIKCPTNSECINIPGSYVCRCVNGYRSTKNGTTSIYYDHQCKDINECSGMRGIDYVCDIFSICINTPGGYNCISNDIQLTGKDCGIKTLYGTIKLVKNGETIIQIEKCQKCKCIGGNLNCSKMECDCLTDSPKSCCKKCFVNECDSKIGSKDQNEEIQKLDCLLNNSICSNNECPKISCQDSITIIGQCCRYCRSDPIASCLLVYENVVDSSLTLDRIVSTCLYNDKHYNHGEKIIIQNQIDGSCIKCLCWNQYFCCSKTYNCDL